MPANFVVRRETLSRDARYCAVPAETPAAICTSQSIHRVRAQPASIDEASVKDPVRVFETGTRFAFSIIALVLALFALTMSAYGIGRTFYALFFWEDFGDAVLRGVGYIVISIAVFEVAKYLVEEEVMRGREMRSPGEARRSLTKFISTVSIAVFLEALVTVFRVSHTDVADLIYPALLLLTATIMIIGLGVFQRLSAIAEQQIGSKDKRTSDMKR
jgi:putative Mn2+ efflux pump MntP